MNTLGGTTKTTFLKGVEAHNLHEEFEVEGLKHLLTFSAALVTSNTIDGYVGGVAMTQITFASTSDATMAAIAAAINGMTGVESASVRTIASATDNDRVIVVTPTDQVSGIPLTGFVVAAGASQATVAVTNEDGRVYAGMPVEQNATTGKIQPVTVASHDLNCIGIAIHDAIAGELATVALRANCIINARSADALAYGPVKFSSYDTTNGYNKVTDGSVTVANQMGWTLDDTAGADETVRVAVKK